MSSLRRLQRRVCGLLSAVLLAGVLLPSLAAAGGAGGTWAEVCTIEGSRWVLVSQGVEESGAPSNLSHATADHCPLCASTGYGAAPPPATGPFAVVVAARNAWPGRFYHAAATPHPWRPALPRAPPRIS